MRIPGIHMVGGHGQEDLWVALAARGDQRAFEALVRAHGRTLIGALERLLGDRHLALDASQEVWLKVYRNLASFRAGAAFRPWLFSIAFNHGRDLLRAAARRGALDSRDQGEFEDGLDAIAAPANSDPVGALGQKDMVCRALVEVDPIFREALVLVDGIGMGYAEAAKTLGTREGTVKSRVHRGREAFRRALERLEPHIRGNAGDAVQRGGRST